MKSTFALNIEKGCVELSHGAGGRGRGRPDAPVHARGELPLAPYAPDRRRPGERAAL